MQVQKPLIEYLENIILNHSVVSISGESGTGKTSFALYIMGKLIEDPSCCIWIQASELFPKARVTAMFRSDQEKTTYVLRNTLIAPPRPFQSYSDQTTFFLSFGDSLVPPYLKFMVIDNISHHLRYELSTKMEIQEKVRLLDEFYESVLYPLILKCQREKVILILIHEVSFDINTQQNRPFFYKLYERIKGVQIVLNKSLFSKERTMDIDTGKKTVSLGFAIKEDGFYSL
jgi:RecA/RadA recombinase